NTRLGRRTFGELPAELGARERGRCARGSRGVWEVGEGEGSKEFIRFALPVTQHARRHENAIVKTLHGYSLPSKMIGHGPIPVQFIQWILGVEKQLPAVELASDIQQPRRDFSHFIHPCDHQWNTQLR